MCEPGSPTYPQWFPLHKLHVGTATTVAELARECQLDTGAMTRLLDRLEAKGLCRRVRSLSDRRVVNIELTDEGRNAAEQVPHVLSRVQNEHLAGFDRRARWSSPWATCAASSTRTGPRGPWRKNELPSSSSS